MSRSAQLDEDRRALGAAAVLSVDRACELLPVGRERAREWLRKRGLISDLDGSAVVVWGDVVAALSRSGERPRPTTRPRRQRAPSVQLDPE